MIRELGEVKQVDADQVLISTQLKSGCSGCHHQNHCGAGLLSRALPGRRGEFSIENTGELAVGQQVELQLPRHALTRFSLILYILPLLTLFGGALLGHFFWPQSEGPAIALAAIAMFASFALLRRFLRHRDVRVQRLLSIKPATADCNTNRL